MHSCAPWSEPGCTREPAALVAVRLDIVPLPTCFPRRLWRVVGWVDILLDVICGMENTLWEGCQKTTTGVSQHWFSGHFQQVFFNTNTLPHINICEDVYSTET